MISAPAADANTRTRWDTSHFAIVTLWAGHANAERTLDWLATAELPPHTSLYWLDNSGGKFTAQLRADWQQRLRPRFRRLALIHGGVPFRAKPGNVLDPGRNVHVARLYNRIFPRVSEEIVVTLEDDMVPPREGVRSLLHLLETSDRAGLVAGVYRDRGNPTRIAAALDKRYWLDIPQYDELPAEPFEVGMSGAGFAMMPNRILQQVLPVRCQRFASGYELGWDGNLGTDLTALGYRLILHPGIRCTHFCAEVIAFESAQTAT
jgi:hypothetical protein